MRVLPGMTVVDVADATETTQVVAAIADLPGPVYLRLKRGEIPVIFPEDHRLSLDHAQVLAEGPINTCLDRGTTGGGAIHPREAVIARCASTPDRLLPDVRLHRRGALRSLT